MEIRILAPTGALGAGFDEEAFRKGVALDPDVIACDAGSTDSGPSALGSGRPKLSREAVKRDLRLLLQARAELDVPLVIGSCGTSGRDDGVDHVAAVVREIAAEEQLHFTVGLIYSDQSVAAREEIWDQGRLRELPHAPALDRDTFLQSHVVAMMGVEPIESMLERGVDVVLAGRASDTALFAAVPHLRGADPGLTWHAAKTIECGAACAIPPSANGLFVYLRDDHFDVHVLADDSRLTPVSVAAHTLYENADPFRILEPSGALNTTNARYEAIDDQTVRVSGAVFEPAEEYTVKLEGAIHRGFQTVIIGGVRDKVVIERLPALIPFAKQYFAAKIIDVFDGEVDPDAVQIDFHLYGHSGTLGIREPRDLHPDELGVLITVTGPTQEITHAVSTFVAHASSHLPVPEYDGLVTTIAYPFSPPEIDRGPIYAFTINHVVTGIEPNDLFRTSMEVV